MAHSPEWRTLYSAAYTTAFASTVPKIPSNIYTQGIRLLCEMTRHSRVRARCAMLLTENMDGQSTAAPSGSITEAEAINLLVDAIDAACQISSATDGGNANAPTALQASLLQTFGSAQSASQASSSHWKFFEFDEEQGNFTLSNGERTYKYRGVMFAVGDVMTAYAVGDGTNKRSMHSEPFTELEIASWIKESAVTNMVSARKIFMQNPRAKGLSATFDAVWREVVNNRRGRPSN